MPAAASAMDVEGRLLRIHSWLVWVLLVLAWVQNLSRLDQVRSVPGVVATLVIMTAWSAVITWWYRAPGRRGLALDITDGALTLALVLSSQLSVGPGAGLGATVTGYWLVAAPIALAIRHGWLVGALEGWVIAGSAFALHPSPASSAWAPVVLVGVAAAGAGWLAGQVHETIRDRDASLAATAALHERERLNRIVHDGVLQVLAMVERDGSALGPRGQLLARLAHEQETELRTLLRPRDPDVGPDVDAANLSRLLDAHANESVSIATMADDVSLPAHRAAEIDAVVTEVLNNVDKHAGMGAHAWLLVEREADELVLSIRDNGVGATAEQMDGAFERGRLGVRESIRGRIASLGGQARLSAAPGRGVEWEFRIPMEAGRG